MGELQPGKSSEDQDEFPTDDEDEEQGDFTDDGFNPRCPYCGTRAWSGCAHLLGSCNTGDVSWLVDPFGTNDIPVAAHPMPDATDDTDWSNEQIVAAFGDLAPALDGYERYGLASRPSPPHLLDALRPFLITEVIEKHNLDFGMGEVNATCHFFSSDAVEVQDELVMLLDRLREGFARLATLPPRSQLPRS